MTNSQRLATVRSRLLRWLAEERGKEEISAENGSPILTESILIRDEFYCGRRFQTATHEAVWFMEEDELKIYRRDGMLACVLSGDQLSSDNPPQAAEQETDDPQPAESPDLIKLPPPSPPPSEQDDQIRRAA
jgi:hypothetical protein